MSSKTLTLQDIQERFELAKRARLGYERDWRLNMAYLNGQQYVSASFVSGDVRLTPLDFEGPKPIVNLFPKIARIEQTKILRTSPIPVAMPMTDADDDVYAAKMLTAYFHHLRDDMDYERKTRQAAYWMTVTGNVFFKWYWAGGKARMSVIPPYDVYPDPYATTFNACRWVIYSQFMDEDSVAELYGVSDKKISALNGSFQQNDAEASSSTDYGTSGHTLEGVAVHEYWEPPSKLRPKGRFVAYAGHEVLYEGDFPFTHGRMPFTHASHVERGTSKWGASVFDQIRFLQDELNRVERQIIENRQLANGIWFIPPGVELETDITGEPRQVIPWTGDSMQRPNDWFVQANGMAGWVAGEPDRIKQSLQDLVQQHEVSNAGVPGRVESGQAIQLLQETDDSVIKQTIHALEEAIGDGFLQCGLLYKQFGGNSPLMVRVYDKNNAVQVQKLMRDMVPLDLRVVTRTTTGLPTTVAGKWDRILNLVAQQVIDPNYALELLDISPQDPDLRPESIDIRNADAENTRIMQSRDPVLAERFDNHLVHMARHDRFCKTPEFKQAVAADPEVKVRFEAHHKSHVDAFQMQLQEQALLQPQAAAPPGGGAPPDAGGPPSPQPPPPADNGSPAPVA